MKCLVVAGENRITKRQSYGVAVLETTGWTYRGACGRTPEDLLAPGAPAPEYTLDVHEVDCPGCLDRIAVDALWMLGGPKAVASR